MTTLELQDRYIAALHAAEQVTTRYGNQRKARTAAHRQMIEALQAKGYDEKAARQISRDAYDVFALQLNSEEE